MKTIRQVITGAVVLAALAAPFLITYLLFGGQGPAMLMLAMLLYFAAWMTGALIDELRR